MKKKLFLMVILLAMKLFPSDFLKFAPNNHGSQGLINIPSARFYSAPSGMLSFYRGFPDRKATLTLYPYDWLEASIFYSSFKDKPYGSIFTQDYKDKGFNLKFKIKDQGKWPAFAIGANDIGGTGYYNSEYIVSSYLYGKYDIHIGLGWGRMNHYKNLKNPFLIFGNIFDERNSELGRGGTLSFKNLFAGENISMFAGVSYKFDSNYQLKIEYDPTETPGGIGFKKRKSDFNIGINYYIKNLVVGINSERGSNLSFNFSYSDNFLIQRNDYKKINMLSYDKYRDLIKNLELNEIGVSKLEKNNNLVSLSVTQNLHKLKQVNEIIDKSIADTNVNEEVLVSYKIAGLEVTEKKDLLDSELLFENKYSGFNQNISFKLRPFLAGREDFIKAALLLEHDAEFIFSENLLLSTNIKLSVLDNFDDLIYPPVDVYPAQVRSDIKKYLNNLGDKPSIGRAQFEYFKTFAKNNHMLLTAGIYEEMFSGFGVEYLNYDMNRRVNWGFEANKVYKRDYDFYFGLLGYQNITYHLNLYYKNRNLFPFDIKLSYGEYLAGDIGSTIEIKRSFLKGVEIGAFASFTNVSYEKFGEGSFDKGIFFKIPIGKKRKLRSFVWRPLTKDPASKLIKKNNIYDLVDKYSVF